MSRIAFLIVAVLASASLIAQEHAPQDAQAILDREDWLPSLEVPGAQARLA